MSASALSRCREGLDGLDADDGRDRADLEAPPGNAEVLLHRGGDTCAAGKTLCPRRVSLPGVSGSPNLVCRGRPGFHPRGRTGFMRSKHDGFRIVARRHNGGVRLITRHDFADRFPQIAEATSSLPVQSCFIDRQVIVVDERGLSVFDFLRYRCHDHAAILCAFDLIEPNGETDMQYETARCAWVIHLGI
jgi:hypothetical protein